jgi:S-layer protein
VTYSTSSLTTGLNTLTGGAGDDAFNTIATGLSAGDVLDGGDGTDTLTFTDNVGGMNISVPSVTVKNIENVAVNTTGSVGVTGVAAVTGVDAVAQVRSITPTVVDATGTSSLTVGYGAGSFTTSALDATITAGEVNTLVKDAINALAGSTVAAIVDGRVVVTAPTAGTALPTITVADGDSDGEVTFAQADLTANVAGVTAKDAVTAAAFDVSGFAGLADVNISAKGAINIKGAATSDVTAATTSGKVTVVGGTSQTVTAKGGFDLSGSTGAISVTDSAQGAVASTVVNGTTVDITSTSKNAGGTTGTITVGSATKAPTGDVTITSSIVEAKGTTNTAGGAIAVTGGEDVVITQSASKAVQTTALANGTITNAPVTVTGKATTKSVTVDSSAAVTAANTVLAVDAVTEVNTLTFAALTSGQTQILNGLTFTAGSAGTTAAQTAAAFSNLTAGATNGPSTLGVYSGAFSSEGWTSGSVGGTAAAPTVVFTGTTAGARTDLADTGTGTDPTVVVTTDGVTKVAAAGKTGVTANTVTVTDVNNGSATKAGTITDVTAHNYTTLAVNSNALTNLTVLGGSGNITIGNGGLTGNTAKTLNLSVDGVTGGTLDDADVYTTLNITTKYTGSSTTTSSTLANVTSTSIDDLNVSGDKVLVLTSTAGMSGLVNVDVNGTAGLSGTFAAGTMKTINTADTTGKATITFDATKATYTGGAGVDAVTTSAVAPTKAISLGAGDDKLTLASGTTAVTGAISGGDGDDTLSMVAADIVTADNDLAFSTLVTGFEALEVTGGTGSQAINLTNMGITNNITVATGAGTLTVNNIADGGNLTLTGDRAGDSVALVNALFATPTTNSINVTMSAAAGFDGGTVTAANVETVNLTATDTTSTATAHSLVLTADKASTVNVSGNAGINLTLTSSTKIATLDASASTGAVDATSVSTAAITMKGGSAGDSFTANGTTASTLIGNGGADTLTTNGGLTTLTGGDGLDLFIIATAGANDGIYSTITDASAGDRIELFDRGTEVFNSTKLELASTASFSDYLDAASASTDGTNSTIRFFEFGGNTYIVEDNSTATTFVDGADIVVGLTGIVDLSTASLSYDAGADPVLMIV